MGSFVEWTDTALAAIMQDVFPARGLSEPEQRRAAWPGLLPIEAIAQIGSGARPGVIVIRRETERAIVCRSRNSV